MLMNGCPCLKCPFLCAGVQLEVVNANCGDDVAFTSRVARAVGEYDLVVAFAAPQQTQVLEDKEPECVTVQFTDYSTSMRSRVKVFHKVREGDNKHKTSHHKIANTKKQESQKPLYVNQ